MLTQTSVIVKLRAVLYLGGVVIYGFVYRCPTTGHKVRGFVQNDPSALDGWLNAETRKRIDVRPTHWREWQEPH